MSVFSPNLSDAATRAPLVIGLLWLAFAGSHLLLSSAAVRPRLHRRLGARGFRGLYSLVALATFLPLVGVFAEHPRSGPLLWTRLGPPAVALWVNHLLMALGCVLVVAALLPGSAAPSSLAAPQAPLAARGVVRITRHPLLAGFACFGLAHLTVNGALGDALFFLGFPLFAWIGARHQDARLARDRPGYAAVVAETSFLPFAAIVTGRQRLVARELPLFAVAAGLVLFLVLRSWHDALFSR